MEDKYNIEYYYQKLQESISIVEEDEENKEALEEVTTYFKEVYECIKMFLIARKERYYGYFLMDMDLKIDYYFPNEAGVTMNTFPFTILINPLLLGKCTIQEMVFIICHEIEHIVLEHPVEAKAINREHDMWKQSALNFAMDASVNDRLNMEISKYKMNLMSFPDDGISSEYLSEEYDVEMEELREYLYYYEKIVECESKVIENEQYDDGKGEKTKPKKKTKKKVQKNTPDTQETDKDKDDLLEDGLSMEEWMDQLTKKTQDPADSLDEGAEDFWDDVDKLIDSQNEEKSQKTTQRNDTQHKDGERVIFVVKDQTYRRIITAKNRPKGLSLHKWTELEYKDEIKEHIRQFVQKVMDGISDDVRKGFPKYQMEALEKVLKKPEIPWEQVLKKYMNTIPNGFRKTRTRLSRRQPERYDVSGRLPKRTIDIVVAIDTSASMSKELLEKIFTEIFSLLKDREFHLTIIECDAAVQNVYEAKRMSDINMEVRGRMGTSFVPVIEYVNADKRYRKSLLIYFTDGMGDREIPKPLVYRMLWVLPAGYSGNDQVKCALSVKEPYGDIIHMNTDMMFRTYSRGSGEMEGK